MCPVYASGIAQSTPNAIRPGVTVILPAENNLFTHKLPAAVYVLNGFGKSLGLMQVEELGNIETPIFLTNTLNVGLVHDAAVGYMIETCAKDGVSVQSVNPIVCECNDAYLNDIQQRVVGTEQGAGGDPHRKRRLRRRRYRRRQGDELPPAQRRHRLGSASRVFELGGTSFTLGALVLSNHGLLKDLTVGGKSGRP